MLSAVQAFLYVAWKISLLISLASGLVAARYAIQVMCNRKPGVRMRLSEDQEFISIHYFGPEHLTEKGLEAQARYFFWRSIFITALISGLSLMCGYIGSRWNG